MVEKNVANCDEQIQKILALFYDDEPLKAYKLLQQLQSTHGETEPVKKFSKTEEMTILKQDYEILTNFQEEVKSKRKDWVIFIDKPDYKIWYRYEPGQPICSLYLERVFHAPIINLMAVLAEAQLYKEWVPMTSSSEVLSKVSNFR